MFEQVKLDYATDALEPHIDKETMETHYGKHHATYTANLNNFAEKAGLADMDIEKLLASLDSIEDEALRNAIRNNGGGFYNHNLYFSTISPDGNTEPEGKLLANINESFGSFAELKKKLTDLAIGQFGSGWAWLSTDTDGSLYVSNTQNQDNPISLGTGRIPIVAIDVWEHAYYLKYKNLRADYVKELFEVIDWKKVAEIYDRVTA